jgi:hypothetical protein
MSSTHVMRSLVCGALLTIAVVPSAGAEGTFDIPPGANFNPQKLERVGGFFRDQVAQGKIPGAILLIQQHGKPVYHEFFDDGPNDLPAVLDDQSHHQRGRDDVDR